MASIRLSKREAEDGDLPEVCMRCGAPATFRKRYRFTWHPNWVYALFPLGLLPYIIVAAALTQTARIHIFLCDRHRHHWLIRGLIVWGTFVALFPLSFVAFVVAANLDPDGKTSLVGCVCIGIPIAFVAWLVSIPFVQSTAIHPTEVTSGSVTLARVAPAFCEAVEDYRRDTDDADWVEPPPRRVRKGDEARFYEPDEKRRPRPRFEDDEGVRE